MCFFLLYVYIIPYAKYYCSREKPVTVSRLVVEHLEEHGLGRPNLAASMRETDILDWQGVLQEQDNVKQSFKNLP